VDFECSRLSRSHQPRDDESYLPSLLKLDLEGNDIGEGGILLLLDILLDFINFLQVALLYMIAL